MTGWQARDATCQRDTDNRPLLPRGILGRSSRRLAAMRRKTWAAATAERTLQRPQRQEKRTVSVNPGLTMSSASGPALIRPQLISKNVAGSVGSGMKVRLPTPKQQQTTFCPAALKTARAGLPNPPGVDSEWKKILFSHLTGY